MPPALWSRADSLHAREDIPLRV